MDRNVYVVVSQTGTILSRILKSITKKEYNHASISLNKNLAPMYSFGRMNPYNPVWGGFVLESIHAGTFKRFKNTKAIVLELPFDDKDYEDLVVDELSPVAMRYCRLIKTIRLHCQM